MLVTEWNLKVEVDVQDFLNGSDSNFQYIFAHLVYAGHCKGQHITD